jgi:hypothetical protein
MAPEFTDAKANIDDHLDHSAMTHWHEYLCSRSILEKIPTCASSPSTKTNKEKREGDSKTLKESSLAHLEHASPLRMQLTYRIVQSHHSASNRSRDYDGPRRDRERSPHRDRGSRHALTSREDAHFRDRRECADRVTHSHHRSSGLLENDAERKGTAQRDAVRSKSHSTSDATHGGHVTRNPLETSTKGTVGNDGTTSPQASAQSSTRSDRPSAKHDDTRVPDNCDRPRCTVPTPKSEPSNATTSKERGDDNTSGLSTKEEPPLLPPAPTPKQKSAGPPASQEPHALLAMATRLIGECELLRDLTAIPMRTMLSPLALQMLRMLCYKGTRNRSSDLFDPILQFMGTNSGLTSSNMPFQALSRIAPNHPHKPSWMTETQPDLFGFEFNKSTEARTALFWLNKILPHSTAPADLQKRYGVQILTVMHELQALRELLNLAESHQTPEAVFEAAMGQSAELHVAPPSPAMLAFGKTQLRPTFAQHLSMLFQRDLALTTAYALLKFGLHGCAIPSGNAGLYLPAPNPVQVTAERMQLLTAVQAIDELRAGAAEQAAAARAAQQAAAARAAEELLAQQALQGQSGPSTSPKAAKRARDNTELPGTKDSKKKAKNVSMSASSSRATTDGPSQGNHAFRCIHDTYDIYIYIYIHTCIMYIYSKQEVVYVYVCVYSHSSGNQD